MQDSELYNRKDKYVGAVYIRTNRETGQKYQVTRNTDKHTNAI